MDEQTNTSRNYQPNRRFASLKSRSEGDGLAYTSVRDAALRGEFPVLKIGRNEKHQRMYVERSDWDHWIEQRKRA